jgi:hypothetical protein
VDAVVVDERLLAQLTPQDRAAVEKWESDKREDEERRKTRGDPVTPRGQSEQSQRDAMFHPSFKPDVNMGGSELATKLLGADQDFKDMVRRFGPEGFVRIVRQAIRLHSPRLRSEERQLIDRKAALLNIRESHKYEIEKLKAEIERLTERATAEKGLRDRALAENESRRREITALYAELEEVVAARDAALGAEADANRQLEEIQRRIGELTAANRNLENKLRELERVATQSGSAKPGND